MNLHELCYRGFDSAPAMSHVSHDVQSPTLF